MAKNFRSTYIFRVFLVILMGFALLAGYIFVKPEHFVKPVYIINLLVTLNRNLMISYDKLEFQTTYISFGHRRFTASGNNICVIEKKHLDVCVRNLEIDIEIKLGWFDASVVQVHLINIDSERAILKARKTKESTKNKHNPLLGVVGEVNKFLNVSNSIDIKIRHLLFENEGHSLHGAVRIKSKNANMEIYLAKLIFDSAQEATVHLFLKRKGDKSYEIEGKVEDIVKDSINIKAKIKFTDHSNLIANTLLAVELGARRIETQFQSVSTRKSISVTGNADYLNSLNASENLDLKKCNLTFSFTRGQFSRLSCDVSHRLGAEFAELLEADLLPKHVLGRLFLEFGHNINLELKSYESNLVKYGGRISFDNAFEISQFSFNVTLKKLSKFLDIYKNKGLPIYSPFHVLDGSVMFTIISPKISDKLENYPVDFVLRTDLQSKEQKLISELSGNIQLDLKSKKIKTIQSDLSLHNVRLVLPHIGIRAAPKVFSDRRIRSNSIHRDNTKSDGFLSKLKWELKFRSTTKNSFRLISNLAKKEIPIQLKGICSDQGCNGFVRTEMVPVNLLNRDATIIALQYSFNDRLNSKTLDGALKVNYADYIIHVHLAGDAEIPNVKFESTPPLSQEDTLAVLLFGSPMSSLAEDRASTAKDTSDAIADRALGLASLYYLASTPIESVRYDPQSKIFSAKVSLGSGASFVIGADSKQVRSVGIRKRIGSNFAVTSEIPNDPTSDTSSVTGFLEWFTRY